jgi:tetratricopeptide (TPR) repeat protein
VWTRPQYRTFSAVLVFILACALSSACIQKVVRVPVTPEDILRANEAAQEGDIAFSRKDYYAALIKYLEAVRLNPNNDNMFNRLGIIYSQLKFYEEAKGAFERARGLNPKSAYAANNLGSVYFAQRDLKKAEKYFRKAISLKGNEASFHMNLGSIYLERKKADKAMAEWRKGLALDPDVLSKGSTVILSGGGSSTPRERYYFLARLFASTGNVESAIENLKLAIANGFTSIEDVQKEHDFDMVRRDDRFMEFMKEASLLIRLHSKVGLPSDASVPAPKN